VALWDALIERGGLWFGWSGGTTGRETRDLTLVAEGNVDYALVGLTEAEHEGYYLLVGGRPRGRDSRVHVTKTRDKAAALKFQSQVIKRHGRAEEIVTDGLRSYSAVLKDIGAEDKQVTGRWENNRMEHSHQPFRRRERAMLWFRRMHSLQKFGARSCTGDLATDRPQQVGARPVDATALMGNELVPGYDSLGSLPLVGQHWMNRCDIGTHVGTDAPTVIENSVKYRSYNEHLFPPPAPALARRGGPRSLRRAGRGRYQR
jgi:hypothetical protein